MSLTDEPLYCEHGISNLRYCSPCAQAEYDPECCPDCGSLESCYCHDSEWCPDCSECIADEIGGSVPW
jgi:hypothetical protein